MRRWIMKLFSKEFRDTIRYLELSQSIITALNLALAHANEEMKNQEAKLSSILGAVAMKHGGNLEIDIAFFESLASQKLILVIDRKENSVTLRLEEKPNEP